MDTLLQFLGVAAPVLLVSLIGYGWVRRGLAFDQDFVTAMVTQIGAPALVFVTLARSSLSLADISRSGLATLACLITFAVVGVVGLRLAKLRLPVFLPSLLFPNVGNMGLPVCLFAFGERGLALAMVYFTICTVAQFTLGPAIAMGRLDPRRLARVPFLYAAVAAVACAQAGIVLPAWIVNTLTLVGNLTVPLMLLGLGAALASFRPSSLGRQVTMALARLGLGVGVGWAVAQAFGLDGAERGVLIIQSAMPAAVFNYLFARLYDNDPDEVAGIILMSTVLTYLALPAVIALAL